ncbi:MAG: DedA family protein [Pirellulales bacterium]|nr:DedA family protein [Pirellulales bacterium]
MELLRKFIDLFLHLDDHLNDVIGDYGGWTYLILFVIIFCETGLVVTPILPGDSLLFAAGAFAARGSLDIAVLIVLLGAAAVLGDAVNYSIGALLGPKVLTGDSRVFKKEYLDRTHAFYERYGGMTIIIARFVPIVRTFAPFLAGVGKMSYWKFATYNIAGGLLWITVCLMAGYFFGNIPFVKKNFELVVIAIVLISVLPAVFEWWRSRREAAARVAEP